MNMSKCAIRLTDIVAKYGFGVNGARNK